MPPWSWVSGSLQSPWPAWQLGQAGGIRTGFILEGYPWHFHVLPKMGWGVGRSDRQWHHFFLLRCSQFARKHVFNWAEPLGGRFT